jgi:hypothetical protein
MAKRATIDSAVEATISGDNPSTDRRGDYKVKAVVDRPAIPHAKAKRRLEQALDRMNAQGDGSEESEGLEAFGLRQRAVLPSDYRPRNSDF